MIDKKRLSPWIGISSVVVCLSVAGYYFLNKPPVISAGAISEAETQADLKRVSTHKMEVERENANAVKKRKEYAKSFSALLNGQPEQLVVQVILKGDSDSAAKIAKIWEMTEPGNPIARSISEAFRITRTCGNDYCALGSYNPDFYNWLHTLKVQHPNNPHVSMMTTDIDVDGLVEKERNFNKAIEMKESNLDFNFGVGSCADGMEINVAVRLRNRLRKDWDNKKSVITALRLANNLTCYTDESFTIAEKDVKEAQKILETVLKTASVNDLESIQNKYILIKTRQAQKAKSR